MSLVGHSVVLDLLSFSLYGPRDKAWDPRVWPMWCVTESHWKAYSSHPNSLPFENLLNIFSEISLSTWYSWEMKTSFVFQLSNKYKSEYCLPQHGIFYFYFFLSQNIPIIRLCFKISIVASYLSIRWFGSTKQYHFIFIKMIAIYFCMWGVSRFL